MGTMIVGVAASGMPGVSKARGARGRPSLDLTSATVSASAATFKSSRGATWARNQGSASREVGSPGINKGQRTR